MCVTFNEVKLSSQCVFVISKIGLESPVFIHHLSREIEIKRKKAREKMKSHLE